MRKRCAAQVERPVEVHSEVAVPLLVGHRRRVAHLVEARDVRQHVESAELGDTVGDGLAARRRIVMSTDAYMPPGTSANTSAIRSASRAIPNTDAPRSANSCRDRGAQPRRRTRLPMRPCR